MQPFTEYLFPEFHLDGLVRNAEGDVVIGSTAIEAACFTGRLDEVDDGSGRYGIGDIPIAIALLFFQLITEYIRQDSSGRSNTSQVERNTVKTFGCSGSRYFGSGPRLAVIRIFGSDQFDLQSIGILERKDRSPQVFRSLRRVTP